MISKSYKENKNQVLELYHTFSEMCKNFGKDISNNIVTQAERIENEVFNLMVVGEAKSGKSTFINAFIGEEVLPMDVRQCTSAIIKIHRGSEYKLIATTAAGGKSTITGIDEIKAFLKEHAAISDKYRSIPVTTINNEILIQYKDRTIPQRDLEHFLEKEEVDNIFNIDMREYKALIKEYISTHKHQWGKLVTEIDVTFPLPDEMQGITLIDSPGVGAGGNVGRIAEDYISNANAIIFIKSLNGQALEASHFMNFLRSNCTNKKKENLFLILTGASIPSGTEVASLNEQALEMYGKDISKEKIVCVDSKIQLFLNRCLRLGSEEAIDEYFDALERDNEKFDAAENHWLKSKGSIDRFVERMSTASNFQMVHQLIEKFARHASYLQLLEFLENLINECNRYSTIFTEQEKILEENYTDPEALADRIRVKQEEIQEAYNKMSKGVNEIFARYTDNLNNEGLLVNEVEKYRASYEEKLENFKKLPEGQIKDTTFSELKTITMSAIEGSQDFRREMVDRIIKECNDSLIECIEDASSIPSSAFTPNFTAQDFDDINAQAEKATSGVKPIEKGVTFLKTTEKVPYHHLKDHVQQVVNSISTRLDDIVGTLKDNLVNYIEECREVYKAKLKEHVEELEKAYNELVVSQQNNEELKQKIESIKENINTLQTTLEQVTILKKELEEHVK